MHSPYCSFIAVASHVTTYRGIFSSQRSIFWLRISQKSLLLLTSNYVHLEVSHEIVLYIICNLPKSHFTLRSSTSDRPEGIKNVIQEDGSREKQKTSRFICIGIKSFNINTFYVFHSVKWSNSLCYESRRCKNDEGTSISLNSVTLCRVNIVLEIL